LPNTLDKNLSSDRQGHFALRIPDVMKLSSFCGGSFEAAEVCSTSFLVRAAAAAAAVG
jgi:hypothetical protein